MRNGEAQKSPAVNRARAAGCWASELGRQELVFAGGAVFGGVDGVLAALRAEPPSRDERVDDQSEDGQAESDEKSGEGAAALAVSDAGGKSGDDKPEDKSDHGDLPLLVFFDFVVGEGAAGGAGDGLPVVFDRFGDHPGIAADFAGERCGGCVGAGFEEGLSDVRSLRFAPDLSHNQSDLV